ncbi:hypothetical protein HZA97_06855 [Candidatus Woesearchaeota archaeon]|nr:hypothetical protein [Candidatus Woesearchaeota archaeon]
MFNEEKLNEKYQKKIAQLEEELRNAPEPTRTEYFSQYSAFVSTVITAPASLLTLFVLPSVSLYEPANLEKAVYTVVAFTAAAILSFATLVNATAKINKKIDHKKRLEEQLEKTNTECDLAKKCLIQIQETTKNQYSDKNIEKTLQKMIDKHYEEEEKNRKWKDDLKKWRSDKETTSGTAW